MENLKALVSELDSKLGSVGIRIDTLNDIKTVLSHLVEDMHETVHKKEERAYFREHFRTVRLVSNLMDYLVDNLNENYEACDELHGKMHKIVNQKSPIAGNDTALV